MEHEASTEHAEDVNGTYDSTQRASELLGWLIDDLSPLGTEWDIFSSEDGDIRYFDDFGDDDSFDASRRFVQKSLRSIKEKFEELQGLQRRLVRLQDSCQRLSDAVSYIPFVLDASPSDSRS